jgi:hypothetical protein
LIDDKVFGIEQAPAKGRKIELEFVFPEPTYPVRVPFTEIPLAAQWAKFLQQKSGIRNQESGGASALRSQF